MARIPILLIAAAALLPAAGDEPGDGKVRGVTISTHTDGREWGWDVIAPTMEQIRAVGAGWVQTHPYAGIRADGSVRFRPPDPGSPPPHIVRPIREAHRLGLQILIKPHLAYWGSPFGWRGEIEFDDDEAWSRFFDGYEEWIVGLARASRDADAFVVGTELDRTLAHEQRWRRIIARVREVTDAPLTYAANWSDYRNVPFWDALDVVGIQAYFPLTDEPSPGDDVLRAGWSRLMGELREYAASQHRKVVFTELGYNRSLQAAARPWDARVDGPEAEAFQARCLRIALQAIEREPVVVGSFLWKWFPDPHPVGRNFQLATPRLKRVIREVWSEEGPLPVTTAQ
jgi:hypothetical protein